MKKNYIVFIGLSMLSLAVVAQNVVTGTVKDENSNPVLGAMVSVVGSPSHNVLTDKDGVFTIDMENGSCLEINYADSKTKRVFVDGTTVNVCLDEKDTYVDNRGIFHSINMGTQSVSTISGEQIEKNSSHNVGNALYGLIPGLTVMQKTGFDEGASFMIHGKMGRSPLIVVDGIPRKIDYLNTKEIESVSVLKDGAATALWGTRGASGVILIKTKRGQYDKDIDINVDYNFGMGMPINQPKFVDGYTYAVMKNEALYYDGLPLAYDKTALDAFKSGINQDLYPNTDWLGTALRDFAPNNQLNITFRGGGKKLRYYSQVNYKNDYGILDKDWSKDFTQRYSSQMYKYDLNARINLDIDVTNSTKVALSMFGLIREDNRPNTDVENIFKSLYDIPSAAFPVTTSTGLWGGDDLYKINPIAQIADVGYYKLNRRLLQSTLTLNQDLSAITKGLYAEVGIGYDNDAVFQEKGSKTYKYEVNLPVLNNETGLYEANKFIRNDQPDNLSIDNEGLKDQFIRAALDVKVGYDRTFSKHGFNGTLQYRQEAYLPYDINDDEKRQSYIFTGGYQYNEKYLLDVVLNYSGTSRLVDGNRFRAYPGVSAGWVVSNENFMSKQSVVDFLKLRASWGRSGNDDIAYDLDRRYWINSAGALIKNPPTGLGGLIAGTLPVPGLTIEMSEKYNLGLDMVLFDKLTMATDIYYDRRTNMLVDGDKMYSSVIGTGIPKVNIGKMNAKGLDFELKWKDRIGKHFNYYASGTFAWVKTEVEENGEGYKPYSYLSKKGKSVGQCYGLEAIGYFEDWDDIKNSPQQLFSDVRPGDIKYKDQNKDGRIDAYDEVAIGHSTTIPGMYYGLNLGIEYRGFGIDMMFQGLGQYSKMLDLQSVYWPLRNGKSNLSEWYTKDMIRWTEDTKDIANVPRLTTLDNANNFRSSTQWLEDGSYFKLRNLNVYYNLPQKWVNQMKMEKCQIYVRANNLFSIDKIKYMNCEDLSANYPDMTSFYFGLNINF